MKMSFRSFVGSSNER